MRLVCDCCFSQQRGTRERRYLEFDRYDEWIAHLLSKNHQVKVDIRNWAPWENKRSIVVVAVESPVPKPLDVIEYFSKFGCVSDFYQQKRGSYFVMRIDPIVSSKKAWGTVDGHTIGGRPVKIYEKATMTTTDWELINRPVKNGLPNQTEPVLTEEKHSRRTDAAKANAIKFSVTGTATAPPQAEVVESIIVHNQTFEDRGSQGTSLASSVTSNNGAEGLPETDKKSRSRKKNKRAEEKEALRKVNNQVQEQTPLVAAMSANHISYQKPDDSPVPKKDEVQFRGGFTIGPTPRASYPSSMVANAPPQRPQPLPQHHLVPLSVPIGPNMLLNANPSQVQQQMNPRLPTQQVTRPQHSQNRHNNQEIHRPSITMNQMHQPPPPQHYQQLQEYSQRMLNMPYNEAQHYQQRQFNAAFPVNSQTQPIRNNCQPFAPFRNDPPPKFINLFYKMVNDPINIQRNQLCETFNNLPLKDQFREFLSALSLDDKGRYMRDRMLWDLKQILSVEYPHCIVYPFGSFLTGLGDLESDVDIYIDAFGVTTGRQLPKTESSTIDILNRCQKILRRAKCPQSNKAFSNLLIPIREARVPILKLRHSLTSVNCDLSFENLISVRNSELIVLYMKLHPVVRPLIVLIRYWGKFHGLTGSNSIKNYGLILLVLVFLGIKKVVPTIEFLQKMEEIQIKRLVKGNIDTKNPGIIDGWNTSFFDNVDGIKSAFQSSLSLEEAGSNLVGAVGSLAEEFFDFYAQVDFRASAICSYTAEVLPKALFSAGHEEGLPAALDRYKVWSCRQTSERRLNIKTPLCIQDPFILSFNVGGVTPNGVLLKFQVASAQTAKYLQKSQFVSLINAFIPLPKEVGDNKFMTMQKRQKVTKELSREISNYVKFGTDLEVMKNSDNMSEEGEIPLHLLPIEQIIHKNTVRFGKGWESFSSFQPDRDFQKLFVQEIRACRLNDSISPRSLLEKLKVLFIGFVEDFLRGIWRCFELEVTEEQKVKFDRSFADAPFSVKGRKNYESMFVEKERKDKKNSPKSDLDPERVELIKSKLIDLEAIKERIIYKKVTCSVSKPVWNRSEKLYRKAEANLLGINQKECPATSTAAEETQNSADISRKQLKKKKKPKKVEGKFNPLDLEEEVTKLVLENFKGDPAGQSPLIKFVTLIKFDASLVDELPEIFFIFEKLGGQQYAYEQGVSRFVEIITFQLPEYLLYRLKNWLELGQEPVEAVTSPNPETIDDTNTTRDTTFEEEYDLLMPPSSSSECSEAQVLNEVDG